MRSLVRAATCTVLYTGGHKSKEVRKRCQKHVCLDDPKKPRPRCCVWPTHDHSWISNHHAGFQISVFLVTAWRLEQANCLERVISPLVLIPCKYLFIPPKSANVQCPTTVTMLVLITCVPRSPVSVCLTSVISKWSWRLSNNCYHPTSFLILTH